MTKFLISKTYKLAYLRIGNSQQVSKDLTKVCRCNVKTYLPFINITKNKIKLFSKAYVNISWIGRISPEKNLNDFINIIQFFDTKKIIFNIVTDKQLKDTLEKLNFTITKNIKFYQFKNVDLIKIYEKTDILVSTSYYEGFPNVVAEAINYNCLIISSKNYGGTSQLIGNNKRLIYEINKPNDLAKKIKFSLKNQSMMTKIVLRHKKNLIRLSKKYNGLYQKLFLKI